jgi:hypothetical protein
LKKPEDKKTKIITLENIALYKNDTLIPHLWALTPSFADRVSIRTAANSTPSHCGKKTTTYSAL